MLPLRNRFGLVLILVSVLVVPALGGQDSTERPEDSDPVYLIEFQFHILEAGQKETRRFKMLLQEDETGKLRALKKTLLQSGGDKLFETGLKCDVRFDENDGRVELDLDVVFSSLSESPPGIHEWQSSLEVTVDPGVLTVIASCDPTAQDRGYELEVKAVRVR